MNPRKPIIFFLVVLTGLVGACLPITESPTVIPEPSESKILTKSENERISTLTPTYTRTPAPTTSPTPTQTEIPSTPTLPPSLLKGLSSLNASNIDRLEQIQLLPIEGVFHLAISKSGTKLAALSENWEDRSKYLSVFNIEQDRMILSVEDLEGAWRLFFSPDETELYVFFPNEGYEVYDLVSETSRMIRLNVDRSALSPDGSTLASSTYQNSSTQSSIEITDSTTQEVLAEFERPGMVMYIGFSPDGRFLTGGFQTGNHFREDVWDLSSNQIVAEFPDNEYGLVFSADSQLVAAGKRSAATVYSTDNWALQNTFRLTDRFSKLQPVGFSQSADLISVVDRYDVYFLDMASGEILKKIPGACMGQFSQDGNYFITWCYQSEIFIYGVRSD